MELQSSRNLMLLRSRCLIIFTQNMLMRRFLLPIFLLMLPFCSMAQGQFWDRLSLDYTDDETHDVVKCSYWQVFERGNLHRTMNTFYRITSINGKKALVIIH